MIVYISQVAKIKQRTSRYPADLWPHTCLHGMSRRCVVLREKTSKLWSRLHLQALFYFRHLRNINYHLLSSAVICFTMHIRWLPRNIHIVNLHHSGLNVFTNLKLT